MPVKKASCALPLRYAIKQLVYLLYSESDRYKIPKLKIHRQKAKYVQSYSSQHLSYVIRFLSKIISNNQFLLPPGISNAGLNVIYLINL